MFKILSPAVQVADMYSNQACVQNAGGGNDDDDEDDDNAL
jgi:hypothetical protein